MSTRKIDRALSEMQRHLDWLRDHRSPYEPDRGKDICREIGVMECMDTLRDHGAKLLTSEDSAVSTP